MASLRIENGKLALKCYYVEREIAKQIPGYQWSPDLKVWTYPLQEIVLEHIINVFPGIKISEEVERVLTENKAKESFLLSSKNEEYQTQLPLRDYQKTGINFLINAKRAILGDDMGLGKTVQAIATCEETSAEKVLIVCPNVLKWTWREQIQFWAKKEASIVDGAKNKRIKIISEYKEGYLIINYEAVRLHPELKKIKWNVIICDEAHRLKNRKAQHTLALKRIKSENFYLLTGTPMMNRTEELWSLLNILYPKVYTSFWRFVDYYCQKEVNIFGTKIIQGNDDQIKKLHEVISPIMIRRKKKDVLKELPDKIHLKYSVPLAGKQLAMYRMMEKEALAVLENGDALVAPVVIAQITRLRQISVGTELIDENLSISSKFEALDNILDDHLEDHKIVIFSQFRKAIEIYGKRLNEKGIKWVSVTGSQNNEEKATSTKKFQENPDTRVMLSTIQAGGLGLTWTAADMVIFLDKHWTPAMNLQAEDRLHRIGQKNVVQVINLVAQDTVEDWIETLLNEKQDIFDKVIEEKSKILVRVIKEYM